MLPKTLNKFAEQIRDYDDGRKYGDSILVTLTRGLCADYDGLHTIAGDTVRDIAAQLRHVMVCKCDICQTGETA